MAFAGVLFAALAISALSAGTASAKSRKLILYSDFLEERLVAPGEEFDMVLYSYNNEHVESNQFLIETTTGTATCNGGEFPFSGLEGKDVTNSEAKDVVRLGGAAGILYRGGTCPNTSVLGSKAEMIFYPDGADLVLAGSKGKTEIKQESAEFPIYVQVIYSEGAVCVYKAAKLKGTLTFAPQVELQQIVLTFTKDKVKLDKELSTESCDKHTTVSASFGFQSRSEGQFGLGAFIVGKLSEV
jgi:hypothetical protein